MKSIKAFLIALVLFVISAAGLHLFTSHHVPSYSLAYGTWIDHSKYGCHEAMEELVSGKTTIPVFGSSELRHGQNSGFHANTIFRNSDIEPVFIGEAGYQCLNQAIMVGSLGDKLAGRKVVLVVSPQWFKKKGVTKNSFGNSFSEDDFIAFLQDKSLSDKTRNYIIKRAEKLSKGNKILLRKIRNDVRWYSDDKLSAFDSLEKDIHTYMVHDKAITGLEIRMLLKGASGGPETSDGVSISQDTWDNLYLKAEKKGEKVATGNAFGMSDRVYNKTFKSMLKSGKAKNPEYEADSIELRDLECFLQVCQENNIQPLVVMQPFNGYWYDAVGMDKNQRNDIYKAVSDVTAKYQVAYADMSEHEYDQYYFEDNSHPALKGLVNLNETIYKFYSGNEE